MATPKRIIATHSALANALKGLEAPGADAPSKYKGRTLQGGEQLVGTRIDPSTALGEELVKLRRSWTMAAQLGVDNQQRYAPDAVRRAREVSLRVDAKPAELASAQWKAQRRKIIRAYIAKIIVEVTNDAGRPPTSIGVGADVIDEVESYCSDMGVVFTIANS